MDSVTALPETMRRADWKTICAVPENRTSIPAGTAFCILHIAKPATSSHTSFFLTS